MSAVLHACGEPAAMSAFAGLLIGAAVTAGAGWVLAARTAVRETERIEARRQV